MVASFNLPRERASRSVFPLLQERCTALIPVPRAALREALLNALVHRDYAVGAPVQIRVYADRLKIWNPAVLPEGWTLAKLLGEHASQPFNPAVANVFFRAG